MWTRTEAAARTRSDVDFAFFSTALSRIALSENPALRWWGPGPESISTVNLLFSTIRIIFDRLFKRGVTAFWATGPDCHDDRTRSPGPGPGPALFGRGPGLVRT